MTNHLKNFTIAFVLIVFIGLAVKAEKNLPGSKVVNIKTSAICGMCKKKIEGAVKTVEGVEEAVLNMNSKQLKVKYNPEKTSPDQIRKVIADTGYHADDVKRNEDAYNKLPECCQRPIKGDPDR